MAHSDDNTTRFSTFKVVADLNALAFFSAIPVVLLLVFVSFATALVIGLGLGAVCLLALMADDEFREAYDEGVEEAYEAYLLEDTE